MARACRTSKNRTTSTAAAIATAAMSIISTVFG
jgi:hypothetical protein